MKKRNYCIIAFVLIFVFLITSCTGCCGIFSDLLNPRLNPSKINNQVDTSAGSSENSAVDAVNEKETDIQEPMRLKIYVDPEIPVHTVSQVSSYFQKSIREYNEDIVAGNSGGGAAIDGFDNVLEKSSADLLFEFVSTEESNSLKGPAYFAPVVSFYSLIEDVSWDDLKDLWKGNRETIKDIEGNDTPVNFVLSSEIREVLSLILGECKVKNLAIKDSNEIKTAVISGVNVLSIVSFDQIEKEYKVLSIGGKSVLDKNTTLEEYPLAGGIRIKATNNLVDDKFMKILDRNFDSSELSNRSQDDMVSILVTGVTALTRQVADRMDKNGILYPAEKIRDTLLDADITHISNEVSFVEDCYAARPNTMVFCSKPEYMQLLEYIDTDVLELTGNHLNDYGSEWFDYTLDIYDKEGIDYFGGGQES